MNDNPSRCAFGPSLTGVDAGWLPVESVTWDQAVEFCRVLTEQEQKARRLPTGWEYRLPTEAQWEYACRAGTQTRYTFDDDQARLVEFGWYDNNSAGRTHEVGQKLPNAWGLRDMHGNVCEWCGDWDRETKEGAYLRVFRGGGWDFNGESCRSAYRYGKWLDSRNYNLGFRVALVQEMPP